MNQILNYGKSQNVDNIGIKPVIKFFAVVIILFAIIIASQGVYNIININSIRSGIVENPVMTAIQEGSSVNITLEYSLGIDKVIYNWNNYEEAIIKGNGKTKVQEKLILPIGTNKLNLSIVDSKGKMTKFESKEFVFDSNIDSNKPQIELQKGSNVGTIKIHVTDDKELEKINYQWNDEETITPEIQIGLNSFDIDIAAKPGERVLTVIAIDKSGNEQKISKTIKGTKKPEITVIKDDKFLLLNIKDEEKISKIEYNLNGTQTTLDNINQSEYEFKLELISGENFVIVTAFDSDGLTEIYKGKCIY